MQHPYAKLKPEYDRRLASMKITRAQQIEKGARKLLTPSIFDYHRSLEEKTKTPAIFSAVLFEREASSNFRLALGQGDPWNRVSTHVPRGKGPFASWNAAAEYYVGTHGLNVFSAPLSMSYLCWKGEAWNGFGPRAHGRPTGYLWAGTNQYDPPTGPGGKYVADGVWNGSTVDQQLGIIPLMAKMLDIDPSLDDRFAIQFAPGEAIPDVAPVPDGVGGGVRDTKLIQESLNKLGYGFLVVDGNYGKMTRAAVRAFQKDHPPLTVDGLFGPLTSAALDHVLKGA